MDHEERVRPTGDARAIVSEYLGSLLLCAVVVGSGIAAQRLSPGDVGLQLFENAFATALGLAVLIAVFAPVGGAHFNPAVTLADAALGGRAWRNAPAYIGAQLAGCVSGSVLANLMFERPPAAWSTTERLSPGTFLSEVVATACLVLVIFALVRTGRAAMVAPCVGAYIGAAYFFTASTSFANPAITVGRMFSDTFAGIAPASAPGFVAAQVIGATMAVLLARWMFPPVDATRAAPKEQPRRAVA